MNTDDIRLWMMLVDNTGKDVCVDYLSRNTKYSKKQVMSHIDMMCNDNITKIRERDYSAYRLDATDEEIILSTISLLTKFLRYDRSQIESLINNTSIAGYMSIDDIRCNTGISHYDAAYILNTMPNISSFNACTNRKYFMRNGNVPINI